MLPRSSAQGVAWSQNLQPYTKSQAVFQCPSNPRKDQKQYSDDGTSFGFISYAANFQGGVRDVNPPNYPAVSYASFDSPANVIDIVETTAVFTDFNVDAGAGSLWAICPPASSDGRGCLFAGHTGFSNFLFVDGHVKSMRPLSTLDKTDGGSNDVNLWRYDNDTFIHHQQLDAAAGIGPVEPTPTRPNALLSASAGYYN